MGYSHKTFEDHFEVQWPSTNSVNLDPSQVEAIKALLIEVGKQLPPPKVVRTEAGSMPVKRINLALLRNNIDSPTFVANYTDHNGDGTEKDSHDDDPNNAITINKLSLKGRRTIDFIDKLSNNVADKDCAVAKIKLNNQMVKPQ